VFPEPDFAPEAVSGFLVCRPVLDGKPDEPVKLPLEPLVQGRRHETAQAGDTLYSSFHAQLNQTVAIHPGLSYL